MLSRTALHSIAEPPVRTTLPGFPILTLILSTPDHSPTPIQTSSHIPPPFMVRPDVNVASDSSSVQPRRQVQASVHLPIIRLRISSRPPVPQPPKSIPLRIHIRILKILPPRLATHERYVRRAARPQAVDSPALDPPVVLRASILTHDRAREERLAVRAEVRRGCDTWR